MATFIQNTTNAATHTAGETGIKFALPASIPGGVGIAAIVGTILAHMEYKQRREELLELYRDELAAQLQKKPQDLKDVDFEELAKNNHTIHEQLEKTRKERNLNIGVIALGTLAAVGAAIGVMHLIAPGAIAAGFSITTWLATTAVAMMSYGILKPALRKLGEVLFHIDEKTTHDRIEKIFKDHIAGKVISRERVFDVFVHANPPLDAYIKNEYGVSFDKLKPVDKLQLADSEVGKQLKVAELTEAINQGKIRSTELAFTVEGKYSGVAPTTGDKPKHTLMEKVSSTMHRAVDKVEHVAEKFTGHHPADNKPAGFSYAQRERERTAAAESQLIQR